MTMLHDLILSKCTLFGNYISDYLLGGFRIRHTDYPYFQYSGTTCDAIFHLVWIDIESGNQDHFFLTVYNLEKSILIHHANVSGLKPVPMHDIFRFLWSLPVAAHHLRTFNANLSSFTDRKWISIIISHHYFCIW